MENVENKSNVENKQNNSLMRKTKAQLVDIILRKDSIERGLRADMKGTEEEYNKTKKSLDALRKQIYDLKYDYKFICDEKFSIECELNLKIKKLNNIIKLVGVVLFVSIALNCVLCFL